MNKNIIMLNTKEITEFLQISNDTFMEMPLSSLVKAQDEIDLAKKATEPIVPLEKYIKFFTDYDVFVKFFGKNLVDKYLVQVPFREIATKEHFKNEPHYLKTKEFIENSIYSFEECHPQNHAYTTRKTCPSKVYLVPHKCQNLVHKQIIYPILLEMYPWLENFSLEIYRLEEKSAIQEFYVKTVDKRSLYVPFEAFLTQDVSKIIDRNTSYLQSYFSDKSKGAERIDELLNDKTTKKFLEYVETSKTEI